VSDTETTQILVLAYLIGLPMLIGWLVVGPRWSVQIGILAGVFQLLMMEVRDD
jgi:uncharacterized membrane protein